MSEIEGEQLALLRAGVRRTRRPTAQTPAAEQPVARVAVDVGLAHLDHPFDYLVPESLQHTCVPGCRVRVRFAGQDLDGFVLARLERSEHAGRLTPVRRVVSAEPVLSAEIADLARKVADRYAGTMSDVLRLAVPPRHARAEAEERGLGAGPPDWPDDEAGPWQAYDAGPAFVRALASGEQPRAVWQARPGPDWPEYLAHLANITLAAGRGALLVVPDQRDVDRLADACARRLGAQRLVTLTADLGPAERYRRFLAVRRDDVRCVVGTRAAAFAPVADLGLVACWDDGDDLHAEPRAPYPHVREVLLLRAHEQRTAAVIGGYSCTAESAHLLATGWARALAPSPAQARAEAARIVAAGNDDAERVRDAGTTARLPRRAFETARAALAHGPVLVQVPRVGYAPALACQDCRATARCPQCSGPLEQPSAGAQPPSCRWCGRLATAWQCPECGGARLRAPVVGATRTAEELGRAFPSVPVRTSGGARVLDQVGPEPAIVVATPGAEPVATDGFAAALLLDTWLLLARRDLRAGEEALRRWLAAAALVRGAADGGTVAIVADPAWAPVQALLRWSPQWYAERELSERQAARLPPAVRLATAEGPRTAVEELIQLAELPADAEVFGPVPLDEQADGVDELPTGAEVSGGPADDAEPTVRMVVRAPIRAGAALARALQRGQGVRSARKAVGHVRVRISPRQLD